nr:MAG TPA: hypothetical protein [Caudoviricetes sp.]
MCELSWYHSHKSNRHHLNNTNCILVCSNHQR